MKLISYHAPLIFSEIKIFHSHFSHRFFAIAFIRQTKTDIRGFYPGMSASEFNSAKMKIGFTKCSDGRSILMPPTSTIRCDFKCEPFCKDGIFWLHTTEHLPSAKIWVVRYDFQAVESATALI